MSKVHAVCCSDLHLSHRRPVCRSDDWYQVQGRYLKQLARLANRHEVPTLIAGDLFDTWNQPPELINFVIKHLKLFKCKIWAVPGQHDLPYHDLHQIRKSAYWTLVESGVLHHLQTKTCVSYQNDGSLGVIVHPFGWGTEFASSLQCDPEAINIALVHHYVWARDCSYPDAKPNQHASKILKQLPEFFDAIVCGDNHIPFEHGRIFNCGTFMRRKLDEIQHLPRVGLLKSDRAVVLQSLPLDVSQDEFVSDHDNSTEGERQWSGFVEELNTLGPEALDFRAAVLRVLDDAEVGKRVRRVVLEAVEGSE